MSGSRAESPDWLHSFQAPNNSVLSLSSDSDSSHNGTSSMENKIDNSEPSVCNSLQLPKHHRKTIISESGNEDDGKVAAEVTSENHMEPLEPKSSIWSLSSDSESCPDSSPIREEKTIHQEKGKGEDAALIDGEGKTPFKKTSKEKSPNKGLKSPKEEKDMKNNMKRKGKDGHEVVEEDTTEKHNIPSVSTSMVPLVLSEKVQRAKALVECEGDSIELSGDMGAVGRIVIPDTPNGNHEMYLDLKGTIYKTTIVPSSTFCVVSFGQSEAKIEAIMNDFIQLKPQSNVYEAETMVEGTLDGFSFDSEDEPDKIEKATSHQIDQSDGIEEQTNEKAKTKAGAARKRGTTAGGKPQPAKKVKKKSQVSKKAKAKK